MIKGSSIEPMWCSSVEAEARACLVGLQLAHEKGVNSVVPESDNCMVVNAIQRPPGLLARGRLRRSPRNPKKHHQNPIRRPLPPPAPAVAATSGCRRRPAGMARPVWHPSRGAVDKGRRRWRPGRGLAALAVCSARRRVAGRRGRDSGGRARAGRRRRRRPGGGALARAWDRCSPP
jgi:hypothetical protein